MPELNCLQEQGTSDGNTDVSITANYEYLASICKLFKRVGRSGSS
jgi:hypothetical protein